MIVLLSMGCNLGFAQNSKTLKQELQKTVDRILAETNIPGFSVYVKSAYYEDFSIVSGVSNLNERTRVTPETIFKIGSITKTFTGAAILDLIAQGKLDPDKPVSEYIYSDSKLMKKISVRQVLNHSSGLTPYLNATSFIEEEVLKTPLNAYRPEELLDIALKNQDKLRFEPGSTFESVLSG